MSVASVKVQDVIKGFGDFFLNRIPLPKKEKGMKKTEFKHGVMKTFLEKKQRCDNNFSELWKLQTTLNTDRLSPLIQMWFREEESQSSRQSRQSLRQQTIERQPNTTDNRMVSTSIKVPPVSTITPQRTPHGQRQRIQKSSLNF